MGGQIIFSSPTFIEKVDEGLDRFVVELYVDYDLCADPDVHQPQGAPQHRAAAQHALTNINN